jgi:hypothetical protein
MSSPPARPIRRVRRARSALVGYVYVNALAKLAAAKDREPSSRTMA